MSTHANLSGIDIDNAMKGWSPARRASAMAEWRRTHHRPEPGPFDGSALALFRADYAAVLASMTEAEGAQAFAYFTGLPKEAQADGAIEIDLAGRVALAREGDRAAWARPFVPRSPNPQRQQQLAKEGPAAFFGRLFITPERARLNQSPAARALVNELVRKHGVDGAGAAVARDPNLKARLRAALSGAPLPAGVPSPASPTTSTDQRRPRQLPSPVAGVPSAPRPPALTDAERSYFAARGQDPDAVNATEWAAAKARAGYGPAVAEPLPQVEGLTEAEVARCVAKGLDLTEFAAAKARLRGSAG